MNIAYYTSVYISTSCNMFTKIRTPSIQVSVSTRYARNLEFHSTRILLAPAHATCDRQVEIPSVSELVYMKEMFEFLQRCVASRHVPEIPFF